MPASSRGREVSGAWEQGSRRLGGSWRNMQRMPFEEIQSLFSIERNAFTPPPFGWTAIAPPKAVGEDINRVKPGSMPPKGENGLPFSAFYMEKRQ